MIYSSAPILPEPERTEPRRPSTRTFIAKSVPLLQSWLSKTSRCFLKLQLSHSGGQYSVERLIALHEYTQNTPLWRVLLVCFSTPLPMVLLVLSQEVIPLRDPADGWHANYGIWIRMAVLGAAVTYTLLVYISYMIDRVRLAFNQFLLTTVAVGASYSISAMGISAFWTFPIPFMGISLWPVLVSWIAVWFYILVGRRTLRDILAQRPRLLRYILFLLVQIVMAIIYPLYQVPFEAMQRTPYELPVIFLLPLIKLIMKNVLALSVNHMPDMVPETVIYTVEFFNALYGVSCMQKAASLSAVALIMAIDLSQSAVDLFEVHNATKHNLVRLGAVLGVESTEDGLVTAIQPLCRELKLRANEAWMDIRVRSCIAYNGSSASEPIPGGVLHNLGHRSSASICPTNAATLARPIALRSIPRTHRELVILRETLEILFTCECVILDEYVESVVPFFYGSFILMVVHLPSAPYHTELIDITSDNVVGSVEGVFLYGILELLSLVLVILLIRRNCGLKALHLLAFVLETHMPLVQCKQMIWVLMTLAFRVTHFGK